LDWEDDPDDPNDNDEDESDDDSDIASEGGDDGECCCAPTINLSTTNSILRSIDDNTDGVEGYLKDIRTYSKVVAETIDNSYCTSIHCGKMMSVRNG
jgi:hypothetical protein